MGVILDAGLKAEIAQLEAAGKFSLADEFRSANEISLSSLAFMTSVPSEYQEQVANSTAYEAVKLHHDEKAKQDSEDEERKKRLERAAEYQRQLDQNILRFTIDGTDIEMSQGDLRKSMERRVEELEEEKRELQRNGGDPEKIRKLDNLIDAYQPVIADSENKPLDPNEVKKLIQEDPEWAAQIRAQHDAAANAGLNNTSSHRVSSASEYLDTGAIIAPSLKNTFVQSATPAAPSLPASVPAPPATQQRPETAKNSFASVGI